MHLLSQQTSKFNKRRCYGWQNSRWDKIARKTNGELLSAWYLCTYLRAHFYRCGHGCSVNSVCAHSVLVWTCITATRVVWQRWFSKAERLVDHFQMVRHLKCSIKRHVSNLQFGGQKEVRANPHQPSLPTGLQGRWLLIDCTAAAMWLWKTIQPMNTYHCSSIHFHPAGTLCHSYRWSSQWCYCNCVDSHHLQCCIHWCL